MPRILHASRGRAVRTKRVGESRARSRARPHARVRPPAPRLPPPSCRLPEAGPARPSAPLDTRRLALHESLLRAGATARGHPPGAAGKLTLVRGPWQTAVQVTPATVFRSHSLDSEDGCTRYRRRNASPAATGAGKACTVRPARSKCTRAGCEFSVVGSGSPGKQGRRRPAGWADVSSKASGCHSAQKRRRLLAAAHPRCPSRRLSRTRESAAGS